MLTEAEIQAIKPVRCERKVTDGHGLYLLVTPNGARHWRFRCSFAGKRKTIGLGTSPELGRGKIALPPDGKYLREEQTQQRAGKLGCDKSQYMGGRNAGEGVAQ